MLAQLAQTRLDGDGDVQQVGAFAIGAGWPAQVADAGRQFDRDAGDFGIGPQRLKPAFGLGDLRVQQLEIHGISD